MPRIYESKTWDVPLAGGVDEKSDPRYTNVPDVIKNCKYTKLGSLGKRPGSDCVNPFVNPLARQFGLPDAKLPANLASSERGLLRYGLGEVDLLDDNQVKALRLVGETSATSLKRFSVGGRAFRDIDICSNGSGVYIGFCREGTVHAFDGFVVGLDPATLRPSGIEYNVSNSTSALRLKLSPRGTKVWNVFNVGTGASSAPIHHTTYNPATNTVTPNLTLEAGASPVGPIDIYPQDPDALVIWGSLAGVSVARLVDATGVDYQSLIFTKTAGYNIVAVSITRRLGTGLIAACWWEFNGTSAGTLYAATLNDTGAAFAIVSGPYVVTTVTYPNSIPRQCDIVESSGSTNAFLVIESQDLVWDVQEWIRRPVTTVWWTINGNPAPNNRKIVFADTQMLSKARLENRGVDGPRAFIWLRSVTDAWSSNLLVGINAPDTEAEFLAPLSKTRFHVEAVTAVLERTPPWSYETPTQKEIAHDDAPNLPNYVTMFGDLFEVRGVPFLMGGVYIPAKSPTSFPQFEYGIDLSINQIEINSEATEFYGNSALAGGTVWIFDGANIREDGFFTGPPPPKLVAGAVGFLTPGAKYGYQIVYYSESGTGRASYSVTSTPSFITLTTAQNSVQVTFPVPTVYSSSRDVVVEIYRTVKNGSTFFLVERITINPEDTTVISIPYVDTSSDQAVEAARVIYTTGGVLEFESPPASDFITFAQNRLWTIDDKGRVWFSDNIVDGEDPKFNTSYTIKQFSDEPLNAIAGLDEKTILFTPNEIWVTYGDGPDGTGQGGFAALYKAASDVGCVSPTAITTTPWGVFFQSRDGLCLLNRGLEVTRIGKPVEDTTGQVQADPPMLTSAVLVPKFSEVRFGVDKFEGSETHTRSIAVVIDLFTGAPQKPVWYAYYWTNPFDPVHTINMDAAIYQNLYTWIDTDGYVFKDALDHYLDKATGRPDKWVTMEVQSSFVNMGESEQSFSRVWRTGFMYNKKTDVDVTVSAYVDYGPVLQAQTFQAAASQLFIDRRLMLRLKKQRVYATKSAFIDAPPTGGPAQGTGEGWQLAAVSFEGMVEGGMTRLPATQKR